MEICKRRPQSSHCVVLREREMEREMARERERKGGRKREGEETLIMPLAYMCSLRGEERERQAMAMVETGRERGTWTKEGENE